MAGTVQIQMQIELRKADPDEFAWGKERHQIHYGRVFFLKSPRTEKYEGPYSLNEDHVQSGNFGRWVRAGMVYVKTLADAEFEE